MNLLKKLWFPAAATVLIAVIVFNLSAVYQARSSRVIPDRGAPEPPAPQRSAPEIAESAPGAFRTIVLAVASEGEASELDAAGLTKGLHGLEGVQHVQHEGQGPLQLRLAVTKPLRYSDLNKYLETQKASAVEDRCPLRGAVRLHVSGMS